MSKESARKPMIIRRLGEGALGFGDLRRLMPGVTVKVLRRAVPATRKRGDCAAICAAPEAEPSSPI